jgi:hypothetical protein
LLLIEMIMYVEELVFADEFLIRRLPIVDGLAACSIALGESIALADGVGGQRLDLVRVQLQHSVALG